MLNATSCRMAPAAGRRRRRYTWTVSVTGGFPVADDDLYLGRFALRDIKGRRRGAVQADAAVGQAKSKRIERCPGHIAVSSPGHRIVMEGRQIGDGSVKGDRQLAGRTGMSEQDVRHGSPAALARVPDLQDGRRPLFKSRETDCAAARVDHHDRFTDRSQGVKQGQLRFRQLDVPPIAAQIGVEGVSLLPFDIRSQAGA